MKKRTKRKRFVSLALVAIVTVSISCGCKADKPLSHSHEAIVSPAENNVVVRNLQEIIGAVFLIGVPSVIGYYKCHQKESIISKLRESVSSSNMQNLIEKINGLENQLKEQTNLNTTVRGQILNLLGSIADLAKEIAKNEDEEIVDAKEDDICDEFEQALFQIKIVQCLFRKLVQEKQTLEATKARITKALDDANNELSRMLKIQTQYNDLVSIHQNACDELGSARLRIHELEKTFKKS
jgi:predicted RNA binding protein with dsRBD fold (UPF0201 family)